MSFPFLSSERGGRESWGDGGKGFFETGPCEIGEFLFHIV